MKSPGKEGLEREGRGERKGQIVKAEKKGKKR